MMLQSWTFLFGFLPTTVLIYTTLIKFFYHHGLAVALLLVASLSFATLPGAENALLILSSTLFNYLVARWIWTRPASDRLAKSALAVGIVANIALLGYFKYLDFIVDNVSAILGSPRQLPSPDLIPLGLSFLTFQQIVFLVDSYRGQVHREGVRFSHYLLFCAFFPKQIAGPLVRPHEFFPQITALSRSVNSVALLEGLTRFIFGYFEKVVVADTLAHYVTPVFNAASTGKPLGLMAAWGGLLAFTFQLYFDFVGYTDMALGAARMVGFTLPENFMSPYKAVSISDFWRRWHMTLSRFLRDYLYIPLGGNQKGFARQVINIMITMVLGGLWHGASWTFVIWGALHGIYLSVNHAWRRWGWGCSDRIGWSLTFVGVAYAWVWFRADTAAAAIRITRALVGLEGLWSEGFRQAARAVQEPSLGGLWSLAGIFGFQNISLTYGRWTLSPVSILLSEPVLHLIDLVLSGVMIWHLPTVQEWLQQRRQGSLEAWSTSTGMLVASIFFLALLVSMHGTARTFVYSQF